VDTVRDDYRTAALAQSRGPDNPFGFSERLLELLPAAVYICDAGGTIVRYNRRAAELWGRRPKPGDTDQRFCGSYRLYRVNGDPLAHAATPMAEVLRTGSTARDQEVVIERPDGTRVVVLVNIDPLHGADGALVGAVNCFQDITQGNRVNSRG
jgi:PAS domain S-box-containing protein